MLIRNGVPLDGTTLVLGCAGYNGPLPAWLVGMSRVDMQTLFSSMQAASQQLAIGGKVVSASYGQGDGTRSVTYSQANRVELAGKLQELAQVLGYQVQRRRALHFVMR